MPDSPLVIENLSFQYRTRPEPSIQNISFELKPGEVLLIAGSSGCGKTTLARCMNVLIPRSYRGKREGKVLLHGKDVAEMQIADMAQIVGTLLQDPERQIVASNVYNEIAFGPENLGLPHAEILARVEQALKRLGIEYLRDRETFNLSGGEKQKVALAGVIAMQPSILLLDEPLASLDPASAWDSLNTIRLLANQGMTVLLIEHRIEDVLHIQPDRVMFMSEGEIRYLGNLSGLSKVVNYREVKLPAEDILERAKQDPAPTEIQILPGVADKGAGEALVRFEDVAFGYESEIDVLHGINLEIRRGDVIAVL